jgi:hypothetical protein
LPCQGLLGPALSAKKRTLEDLVIEVLVETSEMDHLLLTIWRKFLDVSIYVGFAPDST